MPYLNSWAFMGHAGQDCKFNVSQSGTQVAKLSVAIQNGWGDKKHTAWANITVFGKQAEWLKDVKKGDIVCGTGLQFDTSTYTAQDGTEKTSVQFIAGVGSEVRRIAKRGTEDSTQTTASTSQDDDLPF